LLAELFDAFAEEIAEDLAEPKSRDAAPHIVVLFVL
jgi:hypothetical protein